MPKGKRRLDSIFYKEKYGISHFYFIAKSVRKQCSDSNSMKSILSRLALNEMLYGILTEQSTKFEQIERTNREVLKKLRRYVKLKKITNGHNR